MKLTGLTPGADQILNLHAGTCEVEDTSVLIKFDSVHADASGAGTVTGEFRGPYGPPKSRILTVHGPTGTADAFGHIACGELPA